MKEYTLLEIVKDLSMKGVEFISGKYFYKEKEIKDIKKYIFAAYPMMPNDIDKVCDMLVYLRTDRVNWYPLDIIEKAKNYGNVDESELPIDLEPKQAVIINRLLFHPEDSDHTLFICTGIGGSGKSTFLNVIRQLFGNDCASCSLSDLSNGFVLAEAINHRLICSDEIAKGELNLPVIKQLTEKQFITVNPKNRKPYEMKSQSALFFCCNKAPKIDVTDTGIMRRIVFYERNTKIKNPNTSFNKRPYTEEELIKIAAYCYQFEGDDWFNLFEEETRKYLKKDNSVWILRKCKTYDEYREDCKDKGLKPYSEPNYTEIKELFESWESKKKVELKPFNPDTEELPW